MGTLKQLCREMAADPDIMTLDDILEASAKGIIFTQKFPYPDPLFKNPVVGAILGVSVEAGKRVVKLSHKMFVN